MGCGWRRSGSDAVVRKSSLRQSPILLGRKWLLTSNSAEGSSSSMSLDDQRMIRVLNQQFFEELIKKEHTPRNRTIIFLNMLSSRRDALSERKMMILFGSLGRLQFVQCLQCLQMLPWGGPYPSYFHLERPWLPSMWEEQEIHAFITICGERFARIRVFLFSQGLWTAFKPFC